jgi:hypothetical protein
MKTLSDVAAALRRAGATVPLGENKGTIESAMQHGLSIALVIVEEAIENAAKAPTVISQFKMREVSATPEGPQVGGFADKKDEASEIQRVKDAVTAYAHGKILLIEMCAMLGISLDPADKKIRTMAARVIELEAEIETMRAAMTSDLALAGKMRGDLEREIAALKESTGNKHLLDLSMELQERVAYAEKDRDEALKEKDEAIAKAKEKTEAAGKKVAELMKQLKTERECRLANEKELRRADGIIGELKAQAPSPFQDVIDATARVMTKAIEVGEKLRKCRHCDDSGVIETGNNDLPCEHCPKGRTAVFNTMDGPQTGEDMIREFGRPLPAAWSK